MKRLRLTLAFGAALAVAALIALQQGASIPGLSELRPSAAPGPVAGTYYVDQTASGFSEQDESCAGQPPASRLIKLAEPLRIVSVTICSTGLNDVDFTIDGNSTTSAALEAFSAALALPDDRHALNVACTADYLILPSFVITLETGEQLRPTPPIDACQKPKSEFLVALDALAALK